MSTAFATHTLSRTGMAPLRFSGTSLARVSTHDGDWGRFQRWYEAEVYRTAGGRYVLRVDYRTTREPGQDVQRATVCETPQAVRDELARYDPLERLIGFPPGPAHAEKQVQLERRLTLDWQNAVRDLLSATADVFAETIE